MLFTKLEMLFKFSIELISNFVASHKICNKSLQQLKVAKNISILKPIYL